VQSAEHARLKESHSTDRADKAKQLVHKTASEVKLMADVKVLSSEKVAVDVVIICLLRLTFERET